MWTSLIECFFYISYVFKWSYLKSFRGLKNKPYPKSRFNRSVPDPKLKIHNTGNRKAHVDTFPACLVLRSRATCRVSSESLEAARIASNKYLVKKLGKTEFHMVINKVPHDACRFNKMLSCAGADRLQSGMRGSFGKCLRKVFFKIKVYIKI